MPDTNWILSNQQDRVLIRRSRKGDQRAFEALIRKYHAQLSSLVCWHAGPCADTEDILQLILCKVYFSLKKFDINRPFYPWLRRIAVNRCFDERRRIKRRKAFTFAELEMEEASLGPHPSSSHIPNPYSEENRQELSEMLRKVLGQLPREYQEVILLHHIQQVPYEEIAPLLRCTPQAARVKACRARAALRRLLLESCEEAGNNFSSSNLMGILDTCCRRSSSPKQRQMPQVAQLRTELVLCNS